MVVLYGLDESGLQGVVVPAGYTHPPHKPSSVHALYPGHPLGVYASVCTFNHTYFLYLPAHLDRIEQSMALESIQFTFPHAAVAQALHQVCSTYPLPNSRVRIDVLPTAISLGDVTAQIFIALSPFHSNPPDHYTKGVTVEPAIGLVRHNPLAKTADFAVTRQAFLAKKTDLPYEFALLDGQNRILEGFSTNMYGIRDGVLWTAGAGVLAGITRRIILQLAGGLGIPIRLAAIPLAELGTFQEAFLSSSSRGVMPIRQIGEVVMEVPGRVTTQLMQAYDSFLQQTLKQAIDA